MKCYKHSEVDALGVCKTCLKGLCNECIVDIGSGIACRGLCEQTAKYINELVLKSKGVDKKQVAISICGHQYMFF